MADGVQRTHPEGGDYTPPDLREKFLVGAGSTYAVATIGGEATRTLMPNHDHLDKRAQQLIMEIIELLRQHHL